MQTHYEKYYEIIPEPTIIQEEVEIQGPRPPIVLNFNPADILEESGHDLQFLSYDPTVDYDASHLQKPPKRERMDQNFVGVKPPDEKPKRKNSLNPQEGKRFVPTPTVLDEFYKQQVVQQEPTQASEEFRTRILISQRFDERNRKTAPQNQQNYPFLNEIAKPTVPPVLVDDPNTPILIQQRVFDRRNSIDRTIVPKRNSIVEVPLYPNQELKTPQPPNPSDVKRRNSNAVQYEPPKQPRRGSFSDIPINYEEKKGVHINLSQPEPDAKVFFTQQLESIGLISSQEKKRRDSTEDENPKKRRSSETGNGQNFMFHYYTPSGSDEPKQRSSSQPDVFRMFVPPGGDKKAKYGFGLNQGNFHMYKPSEDPKEEFIEKPPRVQKEKRLTKKKQKSNSKDHNRMNKALSEEFLILERGKSVSQEGTPQQSIKLLNDGDIQTCIFSLRPTCSCPDFAKQNICKHLYFCSLKLFGFERENELVFQKALISQELDYLLNSPTDVFHKKGSVCILCCDPINMQKYFVCEHCKCVSHEQCLTLKNRISPQTCWSCAFTVK